MIDGKAIVEAAARLRAAGEPYLVSTVVRVHGSSYRRPGARMIATAAQRVAGSVSGGCLEAELVRSGWWRTQDGPVVVRFDSSDPDEPRAALGCGGVVDVLLERGGIAGVPEPLAFVERALASGRRAAMATVFESARPSMPVGTRWWLREDEPIETPAAWRFDGFDALVEPIVPPVQLFVLGAGLVAVPVVELAGRLGWRVSVWNASGRFGIRERFAGADAILGPELDEVRARIDACDRAVAIVMGHDARRDRAALEMLVASRALYIGVLGPRHRTESLGAGEDPRIHAPVGLDLGAETPAEIALAVTAEILATLRGGTGASLRTRAFIHA
jgi:xanthine/CO dehydrogenase XdhC/CoxF family maturation factor